MDFDVSEIFYSIQGEGTRAGMPCVFVRLAGCNLRCKWCDTIYALNCESSQKMNVDDIMSKVREYNCKFVEITGGEPLTHTNINNLIKHFLDKNYLVAIETNGSIPINTLPRNVIKILDIKCPDSGMSEFNDYNNLNYITFLDEIKFVIASKADFDWFEIIYNEYKLFEVTANIVLSAVQEGISNKELAELILNSKYRNMIRMQLQLHKIIWDANARGR